MNIIFDIQLFASDSAALSVIKKFMKSLDNTTLSGTAAVDEAVKACSNFSSAQEVINKLISDRQNSSSTSDFLLNCCGINLNNSDTGAITGSDAGGSVTKTATSVVPESGSSSYPSSTTFIKRGLAVTVPEKSTLTSTQQVIVQGLYSWWIEEALKLIEESYGYSFTDTDASITGINIEFIDDSSAGMLASTSYAYYPSTGKTTELKLTINSAYFNNLTTSNVDGMSNYDYLDRTIAHELTHAVMAAKVNYYYNLPTFINEGLAELVHGADDTRNYGINSVAANTSSLQSALALNTNYTSNTFPAGYIFLRYLAKQAADTQNDGGLNISNSTSNTVINGTDYADTVTNLTGGYNSKIYAGAGNDLIQEYSFSNAIYGGAGNDTILNIGENSILDGGEDDDFIYVASGTAGKNKIYGGAGNDIISLGGGKNSNGYYSSDYGGDKNLIIYNSGDGYDIIYNFYNTDSLQITGAKYTTTKSGNDLIVGVGSGKITLVGAANTAVNIDGTLDGGKSVTLTAGADTYSNTVEGATIHALAGNDTVNNYADDVSISGGTGDDYIYNEYSQVIIQGDSGNDYLYNNSYTGYEREPSFENYKNFFGYAVSMIGGSGQDTIHNHGGYYAYIDGGADNDYISAYGYYSTIYGGDGNDTISTNSQTESTIGGGAGNDSIIALDNSKNSISGGAGNDIISVTAADIYSSSAEVYVTTINGGAGDDTVFNDSYTSGNVTIANIYQYASGEGNDIIYGFTYNDSLQITGAKYSTTKSGSNLIIGVGSGSITLVGAANTAFTIDGSEISKSITLTAGADTYSNTIEGATIHALAGNDTIYNEGFGQSADGGPDEVYIDGGAGNDFIENTGDNSTLIGGAGKDSIFNYKAESNVADYLGNNVVMSGGDDNDYIYNGGPSSVSIDGGAGDDTINVYYGNKLTINGGNGNDSIVVKISGYSSINGGAGNDVISLSSSYNETATIQGGTGNDTIYGDTVSHLYQYSSGDGNDIIYGINSTDTLQISGAKYSTTKSGNNLIVGVGTGSITVDGGANVDFTINGTLIPDDTIISNSASNTIINGSTKADSITNSGNNVTINALAGNDSISNTGTKVSIYGGDGNDYIINSSNASTINSGDGKDYVYLYSESNTIVDGDSGNDTLWANGNNNTILGGIGEDSIYGDFDYSYINGGAGNDTIEGSCNNATISGGKGNDLISLSTGYNNIYQYENSDGNDTIYGFKAGDTLKISGNTYTTLISNNDIIINVGGSSIRLKDGNTTARNLIGTMMLDIEGVYDGDTDTLPAGWKFANTLATATLSSADDLDLNEDFGANIKNVNASITSGGVVIFGNYLNNSIRAGKGADIIYGNGGNDTVLLDGGNDTYIYSGGNDFILDYTAGQDKIKFETAIQSASVNGSNLIITTGEGKVTVKGGKNKNVSVIDSNDETFTIYNEYPVKEITLPEGWKFGTSSKTNTNAAIITATLKNAEDIDLTEAYGAEIETVDASKISNVEIYGNDLDNSIKGGKGADIIYGGTGNDTVSLGAGMDVYIYSGGNDIVQDYLTGVDSIQVEIEGLNYTNANEFMTSIISGQNVIFQTSAGDLTVVKNSGKKITLMDENGIEINLGGTLPDGWKFGTASKTNTNAAIITATVKGAENIDLNEGYGADVETVDGSKTSGVEIFGNDLDNYIKGGAGNNTLGGGAGNDILEGNTGADIFVYSEGDDRIINYVGGKDSVQIAIDNISKNTKSKIEKEISGDDVIYYIDGAGTLTLQNANGKKIKLMDSNGFELILTAPPKGWKLDSTKNLLQATINTANNEIDLTEDYGAGIQKVDGSKISGGVTITGNDSNNSLRGGAGNDILDGGDGNDTLTSGTGDDVFIYSGGDDYITDYTAGKDSVQIDIEDITIEDIATLSSNVVIYTSEGNVTIKGGKGKQITLMDSNGIEIGGKKIPEGWKFDGTKNLLQATAAGADNYIDLSESYGAEIVKVDAVKITGGVEIYGNDLDNSLKGGRGADIIGGGYGNDTVSLGGGADVYIYSGGDDVIQDYAAGQDSVQIDTNDIEVTGVETSGNDIIYETSAGNIKFVKGKGKDITLMDTNGDIVNIGGGAEVPDGWKFDSAKNLLQATISTAEDYIDLTETYGAEIEKVDSSKITAGVIIVGNDLDNSIKGGRGADIIGGGYGNDTVSLGGGADLYIYKGGDDLILDYATVDAIQIDINEIEIYGVATVSTNAVVQTSEGNITLKGAKTKTVNLKDTDGKKINLSKVSKNVAEENIWFLEDDNNFELCTIDEISEQKFAITNTENQNFEKFAQDLTVLTYGKNK